MSVLMSSPAQSVQLHQKGSKDSEMLRSLSPKAARVRSEKLATARTDGVGAFAVTDLVPDPVTVAAGSPETNR
ncbi:hypothetical protein ABZ137_02880 [Streptomyces bobili]|uniref:hypothetical protein n=1 Tax=Streptomyces bobili TaxID=67280 RepID=UPI0033A0AA5A